VHLSKLFTFIFLFTLPFALVGDLGWNTIAAVLTLSTGYFGLDAIGREARWKGAVVILFSRLFILFSSSCLLFSALVCTSDGDGASFWRRHE